jgi:hypothetical protein
MRRYTVDDVMKWKPCCRGANIKGLFDRRRSVTLVDMLSSAKLDDSEAIWCACRAMDDRQHRLFACDSAESVVHLTTDLGVAACIAVSRRYADGLATDKELCRAAASAAASASASEAASEAAADADAFSLDADVVSSYAAEASAAASEAYASEAACAAVYDAERETQRHALLALALAGEIQ